MGMPVSAQIMRVRVIVAVVATVVHRMVMSAMIVRMTHKCGA